MKSLFLIFVAASLAYGNATLPSSYIGVDYLSMDNSAGSSYIGCADGGCGGEFGGTISQIGGAPLYTPNHATDLSTHFWCVDSQEDFSFGNAGYAAVVPLSAITPTSTDVRYANVTSGGTPGWTFTTGALSGISSAQVRFELAAWLVQNYDGFANSITDDAKDNAIQRAIWDITSNDSAGTNPTSADFAPFSGDDATWVQNAVNCYNNINCSTPLDNWALVSWVADPASDSLVPGQNRQTFLVQLGGATHTNHFTPEPSFYGVLGVGMFGMIFGAWRKKKKIQNRTVAA